MIDLTAVLFAERSKPRGDELLPHVADLYACDRATAYRRRGEKPLPFTRAKLAQFAIGHGYEANVAHTLRAAGFEVVTDERVAVAGLVGHPDIRLPHESLLIECKTTGYRTPKPVVDDHYAIQAAAYAIGTNSEHAAVLVKYADDEVSYPVDPQAWERTIELRAAQVLERTDASAPLPPADPGPFAPWGCKYCDYAQCERNPKHDPNDLLDEALT
jgi:Holliday junction resolvase